jgi:light-regulated signal transduction histidine kinase (bacteriophytochrome)
MTTSSSSCGEAPAKAVLAIDGEQTAAVVLFASAEYAARDWTRLGCRAALARRCGSGRSETAGVGLGLAVCRSLAEAMGGTLRPEETPGGGLTMALSLPAAAAL